MPRRSCSLVRRAIETLERVDSVIGDIAAASGSRPSSPPYRERDFSARFDQVPHYIRRDGLHFPVDEIGDCQSIVRVNTKMNTAQLFQHMKRRAHHTVDESRDWLIFVVWNWVTEDHRQGKTLVHDRNIRHVLKLMKSRPGRDVLQMWGKENERSLSPQRERVVVRPFGNIRYRHVEPKRPGHRNEQEGNEDDGRPLTFHTGHRYMVRDPVDGDRGRQTTREDGRPRVHFRVPGEDEDSDNTGRERRFSFESQADVGYGDRDSAGTGRQSISPHGPRTRMWKDDDEDDSRYEDHARYRSRPGTRFSTAEDWPRFRMWEDDEESRYDNLYGRRSRPAAWFREESSEKDWCEDYHEESWTACRQERGGYDGSSYRGHQDHRHGRRRHRNSSMAVETGRD